MGPKKPSDAAQRLADLGTEANSEGHKEVAAVLFSVKGDVDEYVDNLKNLRSGPGSKRGALEKTYAYLIRKKVEDEEVARLNVEGLREMILHTLNTLMPQHCRGCRKDHYRRLEEEPMVSCLRCDKPACSSCYKEHNPGWQYVCSPCAKVVSDDLGLGRLEEKHLIAKFRGKEGGKEARKERRKEASKEKEVVTLDETDEMRPSQDMFATQNGQEQEEEENISNEGEEGEEGLEKAFLPAGWKEKAGKAAKTEAKKDTKKEDTKDEKKVCIHHKRGRCNFGMSGRLMVDGQWQECPYSHPRICDRLLRDGDRGKSGCKGGCNKLHPKMCYSSMNTKTCPNEACRNGYHVRGTKKGEKVEQSKTGQDKSSCPGMKSMGHFPPLGEAGQGFTRTPSPATPAAPPTHAPASFLEVQTIVRQEMMSFLKELKASVAPPPPAPAPVKENVLRDCLIGDKMVMASFLRELFGVPC